VVAKQLAVAFVLVLSVGCATTAGSQRTPTDDLIEEANAEGLFLEAPLRLSPQVRRVLRDKIGYDGTEKARLLKVVRFLSDAQGLGFQYQTQSSLTAEKAYAARRGDCMSYANLLVALARTLDVPVRFVRITQLPVTWEAEGRFFESSHMAVALGRNASWEQAVIVDFGNVHTSPWRFSLYDDVSDEQAFVLFQNNVAVQRMLAGDVKSAERMLRFFQAHSRAPEIANNLSLVLLQTGNDREALDLLEASVERFPRFRPLFANAVQAARRVGDEDLAKTLESRGRELLEDEPAWNFNEGMRSYHARAYSTAALRFEKALSSDPDNVRLLAWSARAHLAAGNLRRGLEQVERIRSRPPSETRTQLLEDLIHAFPQIEAPVPVAPPPVADRHS
jgi:tetratricopeptide (TPR) repeat protein